MTEWTNDPVQTWDRETIKDRLLLAVICFGGVMTISWCAILATLGWWLVGHAWSEAASIDRGAFLTF